MVGIQIMETPKPLSSVPACTTLPTEGWNHGRVDTSGRWSTMPKLASQPSPGEKTLEKRDGTVEEPQILHPNKPHPIHTPSMLNHTVSTNNQPTTNHLHHQLPTINHQSSSIHRSTPASLKVMLPAGPVNFIFSTRSLALGGILSWTSR